MIEADKPQFVAILTSLAALKPGAKLTREAHAMWWLAMADWSLEEFRGAAAHLARSTEFMPNPYHFEQLRQRGRRTAPEAFAVAREVWRSGGTTSCDRLIDQVVDALGGYRVLGMTHTEQLHFLERRFAEHYVTLREATDVREALPAIAGPQAPGPRAAAALVPHRER